LHEKEEMHMKTSNELKGRVFPRLKNNTVKQVLLTRPKQSREVPGVQERSGENMRLGRHKATTTETTTKTTKLGRFEVFTAVIMNNGVFWVVTPCGSCKNRRFGGTWRLLHQGDKNR
jgi:hypothetical protein